MVLHVFVCKPFAVIRLNTFSQLCSQIYLIKYLIYLILLNLTGRDRESFMRHKNRGEA